MMLKQFSMINLDDQLNQFEKVGDKFSKLPLYLTDFHGSQVNIKKFLYGGSFPVMSFRLNGGF